MSELNVTRNKLRKNNCDSLIDAVDKAKVGDTIILRQHKVNLGDNVQGIPIDKELYIEGSDPNNPAEIILSNHMIGFMLRQGSLHLKNVALQLSAQSYGVAVNPDYQGSLTMENVSIIHGGKIIPREYYPGLIFYNSNKTPFLQGSIKLNNCVIDDAQIASQGILLNNCSIGKLDGMASVIEGPSLDINNSDFTHTICYNYNLKRPAVMANMSTGGWMNLVGNFDVRGLMMLNKVQKSSRPLGFLGADPTKVMAEYRSTSIMNNGKPSPVPLLATNSFKGAVNRIKISGVTFSQKFKDLVENPDQAIVHPYWFNFLNTSITLADSKIWGTPFADKNRTSKGSLLLDHVDDKSRWAVNNTTTSNRGSHSDLFTHLDLSNLDQKPQQNTGQAIDKLNEMIGLGSVKKELGEIIDTASMNHDLMIHHKPGAEKLNMHMVFEGGPGTGKTTVARLVGQALYEAGVLKTNKFVECEPSDMIAGYEGQTGPKTEKLVNSALGGVLFIDEAYELGHEPGQNDSFKNDAVTQLIKMMEDHRDDLVVIMAGYTDPMNNLLNNSNAGLKSRIAHVIEFPDYTFKEMALILQLMLKKSHLQWGDSAASKAMVSDLIKLDKMEGRNSGNGRLVRNFVEAIIGKKNVRLTKEKRADPQNWSIDKASIVEASDADQAFQSLVQKAKNIKM